MELQEQKQILQKIYQMLIWLNQRLSFVKNRRTEAELTELKKVIELYLASTPVVRVSTFRDRKARICFSIQLDRKIILNPSVCVLACSEYLQIKGTRFLLKNEFLPRELSDQFYRLMLVSDTKYCWQSVYQKEIALEEDSYFFLCKAGIGSISLNVNLSLELLHVHGYEEVFSLDTLGIYKGPIYLG